jgi:2-dehydropantoate 2-reductase
LKLAIIGAGGIGGYLGAALANIGEDITFVARGEHLNAMQKGALHVSHPNFEFCQNVDAISLEELVGREANQYDGLIILAKSNQTKSIAQTLKPWLENAPSKPFVLSLQNGVGNEEILSQILGTRRIAGGLVVKISAHILSPGKIEALGDSQVIMGSLSENSKDFINKLGRALVKAGIIVNISEDIQRELWKKLIINNGVNALCALLEVKTGIASHHPKLSQIVLGLMNETAQAARALHVNITQKDVDDMFKLIQNFDSIKPSMLVDVEQGREVELDAICGAVIRTLEDDNKDAPYTKTIAYLLEYKLTPKGEL